MTCHKAQVISKHFFFIFFFEHDNESTLLWDVEQGDSHYGCAADQTILEQLCDAFMSIWTKISEEFF